MKKVVNIPRYAITPTSFSFVDPDKTAWISIGEPESSFVHLCHNKLDSCPNLKISFHDLFSLETFDDPELVPPTQSHANEIVRFILDHKDRDFIINCAAGISRSAAICKYMEDFHGYKWMDIGKSLAIPNHYLYNLLRKVNI